MESVRADKLLPFTGVCGVESFRHVWDHYGYEGDLADMVNTEFSRTKGIIYLDHAGAALFPHSHMASFCQDVSANVYGNPHSHNPSSRLTHDTVEGVRYRILQHFNTSPEHYTVIFTSGSTAALKLLAESFPWQCGSRFCYLTDNHTSVVGMRGLVSDAGALWHPVDPEEVETRATEAVCTAGEETQTPHLFCYPAQSNFCGRKYPLSYSRGIQSRRLYPACHTQGRWFVLLDAACLVSCSPLDLHECQPDFVSLSFYKMFGFPTGLGALLVRNDSAGVLQKKYFGGGTAAAYLISEDYFVPKPSLAGRFEDGTISFLDIIALQHGFNTLQKLTGSMDRVQLHTFGLARYTYKVLASLRHANRQPVAKLYCQGVYEDPSLQGAIVNFNLLDAQGNFIGYSRVDRLAGLYNIRFRTGCFCNTGACQRYLGITNRRMKNNLQSGHICGDDMDIIEGHPTGSVRVSFGYMSTFADCQALLCFIVDCFVEKPVGVEQVRLEEPLSKPSCTAHSVSSGHVLSSQKINSSCNRNKLSVEDDTQNSATKLGTQVLDNRNLNKALLSHVFLYPIKSCAAVSVKRWTIGPTGLLYDRLWMIVNVNGVCLSQKQEPQLCMIKPEIHLADRRLCIHAKGMQPVSVPLESPELPSSLQVCQSKVCGDRVQTVDCGDAVAAWLTEFLGKPYRLIRQCPDSTRGMKRRRPTDPAELMNKLSLVNEAQFLLINTSSVRRLQDHIHSRPESDGQHFSMQQLIDRFRANLVIDGMEPFEEDDLTNLLIGDCVFKVTGRCGRCHMIGVDQATGTRTLEPLRSLIAYREGKVTFGMYLVHKPQNNESKYTLSVGSSVKLQEQQVCDK